jgi:septum formation protein
VHIVLASQSPRRRELLEAAGIPYTPRVTSIDETERPGEDPVTYVRRMAAEKANAVTAGPEEIVLAADTTVLCQNLILGKPANADSARHMLHLLSGRTHKVITGICLRHAGRETVAHEETQVWFSQLTAEEIDEYVASGEPMDKAGAYAIQGIASRFVERIEGSYSNVVGLPVALVWRELQKLMISACPIGSGPPES